MSLSNVAFASGFTSLLIVLIGWALGLYLIKRYLSARDNNTLSLAVILITVGSVWLAIAVNFIIALSSSGNPVYLDPLPYLFLVGWIPGVVSLATGYVFMSIVKEEYLKVTLIILGIFCIVNLIAIYIFIPLNVPGFKIADTLTFSTYSATELPNATTSGLFSVFSILSIIIMLITSVFFIITAVRTTIPLVKARAGLLGIGLLLIALLISFDSIINITDLLILVSVRVVIVIGLIILAMAITLPRRIFKNLA